jgi:27-O-demethylrifamycin SV methyltransferase
MPTSAKDHYNQVTDAWKEFMGDNFHFGYFETEDMELPQATEMLIEKMLELCHIDKNTRILDVGCGIGGPAFYICEKFACAIDGISTSERGVQSAATTSKEKGYHDVRFKVADGLSNGFPDSTFDIVWIMEASHLITDKRGLFQECYRVLKKDGTLVLCDIIQLMLLPMHRGLWHFVTHGKEYYQLMKTFGPAQVITLGTYCDRLIEAGFGEVTTIDISQHTIPTMRWWRDNALRYAGTETTASSQEYADRFTHGCEILEGFFTQGLFGYGMLRAEK